MKGRDKVSFVIHKREAELKKIEKYMNRIRFSVFLNFIHHVTEM